MDKAPVLELSLIIPCCNESGSIEVLERSLFPVLTGLKSAYSLELVFVNDGSTDDSAKRLSDLALRHSFVRVATHSVNRGLGAALRTGIEASSGEIVLTTDCDGTYSFDQIPKLLELLDPNTEIVTASPYHPDGGVEGVVGYRLFLSKAASLLYRIIIGAGIHTYTSLFRAYRRATIEKALLEIHSSGFIAVTEFLVVPMLHGARVKEFPTVLRSRQVGVSKAKVLRIIREHLKFIFRIFKNRITGKS